MKKSVPEVKDKYENVNLIGLDENMNSVSEKPESDVKDEADSNQQK